MSEQEILNAVQDIFRDNFDDDTLEITRSTCADDIEDWDSLEQINLLTAIEKKFNIKFKLADVRPEGCRRSAGSGCTDGVKTLPPRGGQENT